MSAFNCFQSPIFKYFAFIERTLFIQSSIIPLLLNEVQHEQQELTAQSQQLEELRAQNARLQAALTQQNAAVAARLQRLEAGAARTVTLVSH
jgi:hypothetical protein